MSSPLAKKLGIKPGVHALMVDAPPDCLKLLAPLPDGCTISSKAAGAHEFVQIFVRCLAAVRDFGRQLPKVAAPNALVWIAYPKKTSGTDSDLSRDVLREEISHYGWDTVGIVAIDDVWSALRIRPANQVSSRTKPRRG